MDKWLCIFGTDEEVSRRVNEGTLVEFTQERQSALKHANVTFDETTVKTEHVWL